MLSLKMFLRKGLNIESKILGRGTLWCSFGYTKSAFSLILDKSPGYLPDNDDEHDNFYDAITQHMPLQGRQDKLYVTCHYYNSQIHWIYLQSPETPVVINPSYTWITYCIC